MKNLSLGLLIALFSITACQNGQAMGQTTPVTQPAPGNIRPDSTSTPTPAAPDKTPTPTSVVSNLVATQVYTHSSQRFRIDYPANWQPIERPDGVVFIEPGDQAGYSVFFNDVGATYPPEQLAQYLTAFVTQNFTETTILEQLPPANDLVQAQFTTTDPHLGPTFNEVRVLQKDTVVFILLLSLTTPQWTVSQDKLSTLADTLTPLDTSPVIETQPTAEPPVWVLIGPTANKFAFFYPSNWEIVAQEENNVIVSMPASGLVFEAGTFAWPGAASDPASAQKAAQAYITSLDKKYEHLETLPPVEFPLDTMNGVTIDFLYTTPAGESMAGSVITAAREEQMYRVVFASPAAYYQGALDWFNPMYKSFRALSPKELGLEPNAGN